MKFIRSIVLALISLAASGRCFILHQNETDIKSKIEGGDSTCIKEVPYQVMIKIKGQYICGGALIYPNIVLTAAHCIHPYLKSRMKLSVVAGTHSAKLYPLHSFFDGSIEINAEQMKPHPQYDKNVPDASLNYDLGLIKLADNFPLSDRIQPIRLPTKNVELNDELIVSGIGLTEAGSNKMSSCLKYYKPKVVDCTQYLPNVRNGEEVICHQHEFGSKTRQGDSGGPMVDAKQELVGIHTGTFPMDIFQVAINVYHFMGWIHETINEYMSNDI